MTGALAKGYTLGTHRLVPPENTLERITPHLASFGITRCADITGLDRIGIPVCCAIRPQNRSLQVSNGKGLRYVDAQVSACMEAIELFHAENPSANFERASLKSMLRNGRRVIEPHIFPEHNPQTFFSSDLIVDWTKGEDLLSQEEVWLPASAAYLCAPMFYRWSSNGLASGNHVVEATLHALYECIERDAISRLCHKGQVDFSPKRCRFIDLKTVPDGPLRELHDLITAAGVKLVLIAVKSRIRLPTFMAVLLDPNPFGLCSTVNIGYGAHLSATVAATRAITEAAQSRLTFIHGSREDLTENAFQDSHASVYDFFNRIEGTSSWRSLAEKAGNNLLEDYACILSRLRKAGHRNIFRVDMTRAPFKIPVVKVWVAGLTMDANLF